MGTELTEEKRVWFQKIKESKKIFNKDTLIREISKNKDVLDIGCVGQDIDYFNPKWIHNQVREIANTLVGVDINSEGIKEINRMGYEVYHYDKLSSIDKRFDVLLILDVIEHVHNPVDFLNSYTKFLNKGGKIIVTTPNSNRAINFVKIFFGNDYSLNYEHTFWFCPKTFLETLSRTETLEASEFYWLDEYTQKINFNWKQKIIYYCENFLVKKSSNFSPNFMFILELKK